MWERTSEKSPNARPAHPAPRTPPRARRPAVYVSFDSLSRHDIFGHKIQIWLAYPPAFRYLEQCPTDLLYTATVKLYIRVRPHAQALHKGEGYKGGTLHYRCIHILNIEARPQAPQYLWCSRGRSHMHLVALPRVPLRKAPEGGTELLARRVVAYR